MKSTRFFTTLGLAHAFLTLIQAQGTELFSPYTSGELRDTNNCLQNVESINFFACAGDVLNLDGCHPESYGDTRMRLYLESPEGLVEVDENDDYCGTISSHRDFEVTNPGCNLYRLDLGCYRDNTCGIKVTGECIGECHQLPTAAPTQQPISNVSTFPFYHVANQLHDTMMALENVESVHFYACGGDMLDLDACGDPQSMGDSYMRLYINDNNGWDFVDANDDFCNFTASFIGYTVNAPGCHEYRLDLGCYDMNECSVGVHGSCYGQCVAPSTSQTTESVTAYPTIEPTSFPFTYHSGTLELTQNALYNVESVHFQLCGAQDVYLNACNENTLDDSYLRLYREDNGHDVLVAENDDYCGLDGLKSRIHYGLPPGEPCHSYRLDLGCYEDSKCEVQVDAYCDGCPTPEPTKAPTPAGTVNLYYNDEFQCSDWYKRKGDKHHMELEAYNLLCVALDQCTPIGDANIYMKATLHYNTATYTYTDYQNSQYWDSPAPFTITYYPDANCMYPIADVASDCSNNVDECCSLGSATIMGESLSTIGPSGKVPAVFTWPDDCSPLPLLDAHEVDDSQMSDYTLPFQAQVYAKHIQRVEEALHRGHNNFGLSSPRMTSVRRETL